MSLPWAFFLARLVVLVVALTLHGLAHAWVAALLGDPTPREEGRLWPNPNRHLEHIGTLLGLATGLGWGQPVHIKPERMKVPSVPGGAFVALAGPVMNLLLMAVGLAAIRKLGLVTPDAPWNRWPSAAEWLTVWVGINLGLALFNLLPLFPLDGYTLIHDVLPLPAMARWEAAAGRSTLILGLGMGFLLLMPSPWYRAWVIPAVQMIHRTVLGW